MTGDKESELESALNGLEPDLKRIRDALLKRYDDKIARSKYAKLLNLIGDVIPLDATAIKDDNEIDWDQRRDDAVKSIRSAALSISDRSQAGKPQYGERDWWLMSPEERADMGLPSPEIWNPETLKQCNMYYLVPYILERIADAMSQVPGIEYRQVQDYELLGVDPSNVGGAGGNANKPDLGRTQALLIKELAETIPEDVKNRNALIARIAQSRFPKVTRQYVRSTLMRGHT